MYNELTNLLPPDRERTLSRDYILRICVVVAVLVTALTIASAMLLIPTYVFLKGSENAKKIQLAGVESKFSSADEAALSARLKVLSANAATLLALSDIKSVSTIIRKVLAVSHPGITLSNIAFVPSDGKNSGELVVSGSSATRDSLRSYQLALQEAPFALSAALPVSAYADSINISFTITVTLAP